MTKRQTVVWHLPYAVIGGVETLYATILKYIDREKFSHTITCPVGISKWAIGKYKNLAKIRTYETFEDLARTLDSICPNVIMGTHGSTLYKALEGCKRTYPVIEIVHGSHLWCEHNTYMPKTWTKHIVCVSNSARKVYERSKTVDLPNTVIINGVDTDIFNPKKPLARQPKTLAYFGRFLESDKHITKIIQAFKSLGDHHARLHLIGGTPEETVRLKHFVRSLKVTALVKFFGHTDSPERLYKYIDIATVRSEAEGYCNSAAEALATGTPLVCYNFGGILDHVPAGAIAIAHTQAEYAKLLRDVHRDYPLRKKMRKIGLEFVAKEGNARVMGEKYSLLLEEFLSGKTPLIKVASPKKEVIRKPKEIVIPHIGKVTVSHERPTVGVFNPHWHGIATATEACTDEHVHWNANPQIMIKNIIRHKPRAVLFSGMCPGFDKAITGLKRQSPGTRIFAYYHGGISHYSFAKGLFGQGERNAFQLMLGIHKDGVIEKIAVSSPGLSDVLNANGYKTAFCGNIRELEEIEPVNLLPGFHIGNWNRHHDHKHTTIGVGAGQIINGSVTHCLSGHPIVPGLDYTRVKAYSEMPQEKLFQLYRQMNVNVQMSFIETFNISVMEMWAAGRPVIISPSNYVLVEGNALLESYIPKDPTNPRELAALITKANDNAEILIEAQFQQLNKLNEDSKQRWEMFFL